MLYISIFGENVQIYYLYPFLCEEFLDIATPEYAKISAGEGNSYGHPEKETIKRLKEHTNKIYVTKDLGTIILTSNGSTIEIKTKKTDTNGQGGYNEICSFGWWYYKCGVN